MHRKVLIGLVVMIFSVSAGFANSFAQEKKLAKAEEKHEEKPVEKGLPTPVQVALAISIGFSLAIAVFAGAFGQSRAIAATVEAIARQPEASGRIFAPFILGLALIESLVIYMLVVSILLLFVKFA
jgi:F0F1-type ATP synthase membrane subunit c/vacuolar-type H+-ATPase subunit K